VASNTSSTSSVAVSSSNDLLPSTHPHLHSHHQYGYQNPTPTSARRHRSSSSLSARSGRSITGTATGTTGATSVSGVAPARDLPPQTTTSSSRPSMELTRDQRPSVSRQNSTRSELRLSQHLPQHPPPGQHGLGHGHVQRQSMISQQAGGAGLGIGQGGLASPTARYEELLAQREELEVLKRENENLRRRIKELEVERRSSSNSSVPAGSDRQSLSAQNEHT
jgi:hypothetical protein